MKALLLVLCAGFLSSANASNLIRYSDGTSYRLYVSMAERFEQGVDDIQQTIQIKKGTYLTTYREGQKICTRAATTDGQNGFSCFGPNLDR